MRTRFPLATILALTGAFALSASCARSQTTAVSPVVLNAKHADDSTKVLTGEAAFGDYTTDLPGIIRHITLADLPPPYATPSVDHGAQIVGRPEGAWPKVPPGFKIDEYALHLDNPRKIVTAPNGDIFVAESGPGRIKVLRDTHHSGKPDVVKDFATGLTMPFGIAFYPPGPNPKYVYVGDTDSVVRFPYSNGDLKATGPAETIVDNIPSGGHLRGGGHWTRDVVFTKDGSRLLVSVGSWTNDMNGGDDPPREVRRADILSFTPEGKDEKLFASGIRNPVGLAVQPRSGDIWASVNERDQLGDMLPPDYITHVTPGGFYGWPWYYLGDHQDPRHKGEHPELLGHIIVPDVLLQAHSASLCLTFYTGNNFPREFRNDIFAAEHGSWNRNVRTGYKIVCVPLDRRGHSNGEYEDFVTGFVTPDGHVWGRPVGVTVAADGALLFSDDASGTIWRVVHE